MLSGKLNSWGFNMNYDHFSFVIICFYICVIPNYHVHHSDWLIFFFFFYFIHVLILHIYLIFCYPFNMLQIDESLLKRKSMFLMIQHRRLLLKLSKNHHTFHAKRRVSETRTILNISTFHLELNWILLYFLKLSFSCINIPVPEVYTMTTPNFSFSEILRDNPNFLEVIQFFPVFYD